MHVQITKRAKKEVDCQRRNTPHIYCKLDKCCKAKLLATKTNTAKQKAFFLTKKSANIISIIITAPVLLPHPPAPPNLNP
jgi:hypothetical protein